MAAAALTAFLLLTSAYALLAYLPYTYYALVKAPPYEWLAYFSAWHSPLYWALAAVAVAAAFPRGRTAAFWILVVLAGGVGGFLYVFPVSRIANGASAIHLAFLALLPVWGLVAVAVDSVRATAARTVAGSLPFLPAVGASVVVALGYGWGSAFPGEPALGERGLLLGWSVFCHAVIAAVCVVALNLARMLAQRSRFPGGTLAIATWGLMTAVLWHAVSSFLGGALSFEGVIALIYSGALAATISAVLVSIGASVVPSAEAHGERVGSVLAGFAVLTFGAVRLLPVEHDWNSVLQGVGTVVSWIALAAAAVLIRRHRPDYGFAAILAVLLVAVAAYFGLYSSRIFWGRPLGATDHDITRRFQQYAANNSSFRLTQVWLGERLGLRCGELCQILRQHTNIRANVEIPEVHLVDGFTAAEQPPNIFVIVVDSLRPDYLGAYNRKVDFTPHFDEFARDSVVVPQVITPYTGTTLAEPAIWAGMQLLHTHYPQPFARVNNLQRLLHAYGYDMFVSMDTVLRELLTASPRLVSLDSDKAVWNRFEGCSTFAELRQRLEKRPAGRPIFFYAQPMNIHQFARNDLPLVGDSSWSRPGFSRRISFQLNQLDRCFGELISFLKREGLYDNSVIVVTSDHGEGTSELGRHSHSTAIYPEMLRVPLLVKLPPSLRGKYRPAVDGLASLTDITPSLYQLLGNHDLAQHPLIGRSLFTAPGHDPPPRREQMLVASDVRAVYGIVDAAGRWLYVVYDAPHESFLFDLAVDPDATRNLADSSRSREYNRRIVEQLQLIADFYGYRPRLFHSNPETGGAPLRARP